MASWLVVVLSLATVTASILRVAWIGDDSLITLRHALNLAHGWGPGFNATEKVQGYTHPVWFLIWLAVGHLTNQWIFGILAMSVALSAIAVFLVLTRLSSNAVVAFTALSMILANGFLEYSTSGLENPLSHVLFVTLFLMSLRFDANRPFWYFACFGLLLAMLLLSRFDYALIVAVPLIYLAVKTRKSLVKLATSALSALLPLAAWFLWSYITYKTLLPNTFEAKRNVEISIFDLSIHGLAYMAMSVVHDPVIGLIIAIGLLVALFASHSLVRAWGIGVALYLAYIVSIGGDFMAGRFLSAPFLLSLIFLSLYLDRKVPGRKKPKAIVTFAPIALVTMLALAFHSSVLSFSTEVNRERWDILKNFGIADERGFYVETYALGLTSIPNASQPGLSGLNAWASAWPTKTDQTPFLVPTSVEIKCGRLGLAGLQSGPEVHFIDKCALTDRFLAAHTFTSKSGHWRMGHFARQLPKGYADAVAKNDPNLLLDPKERSALEKLWSQIRPAN